MTKYLYIDHPFTLESGYTFPNLRLAYHTYGQLNESYDNVIWICHALTANSDAQDWWPGLVGPGYTIDTNKYFVICVNMLGSCYGSTSPQDINPETDEAYGLDWPLVTTRDNARLFDHAADLLGIDRIRLLMGGSMGGQQALEWAALNPDRFDLLCALATNARHGAWGIAFNETQRMALRADQTLGTNAPEAGRAGLEAARAIGMLSYRHYSTYLQTQHGRNSEAVEDFRAASYQRYQGYKLWRRFESTAYYALSRSMDSHDLGRKRATTDDPDGLATALSAIKAISLIIGIDTDILFPLEEQNLLSRHIPNSRFEVIHSDYGHDGFLIETRRVGELLADFLDDQLAVDAQHKHPYTESLTGRKFALPGSETI